MDGERTDSPATALVGRMRILVPLGDLIDKDAELSRLEREQAKAKKDMDRIQSKLANPNFVSKAPADVVANERVRAEKLEVVLGNLANQIEKVRAL